MTGAEPKRRLWPWILLALLLLLGGVILLGVLEPAVVPWHRAAILACLEGGWLTLVVGTGRWLRLGGAGLVARGMRLFGILLIAGGVAVGAASGWLLWQALSSEVHDDGHHHHHHHWD